MKLLQNRKRHINDHILNGLTYCASILSVVVLASVFIFIFTKGSSLLNFDLLKNDYWSKNYLVQPADEKNKTGSYARPSDLSEDAFFSSKWGIAFVDHISHEKQEMILVEYVDEASPLCQLLDSSSAKQQPFEMKSGLQVEKIDFETADGTLDFTGAIAMTDAKGAVQALDQNAAKITSLYLKTPGGGIRGSILSTGYLILAALLLALPIGIASAIYLNEYAKKSRYQRILHSGIETLTGVPSIIYGLMGVTVLFPVTRLFGASTTNLLLGSLTLAMILLPTIIRSTEEALLVIPKDVRSASLSLGANLSQTIFKVILPCAVPGILTGVLLSIGRVIGESAALIYTCGTFINDSPTMLTQGTSLAVHIWSIMSGEQPNFELASAISIIILMFVLVLNISVKWLSRRLNRAWY